MMVMNQLLTHYMCDTVVRKLCKICGCPALTIILMFVAHPSWLIKPVNCEVQPTWSDLYVQNFNEVLD